jgi:transcriptional regulator with XRE-family HTH domain
VAETVLPVPVSDNPLRRARRRRGFTLAVLADLSGLSVAFLSMVENGQRKLSRRDHINAIAVALGVTPAEIAQGATPGFDEWRSLPAMHVSPFPAISDDFVIGRHRALTRQFSLYMGQGDLNAAGQPLDVVRERIVPGGAIVFDHFTGTDRFRYTLGERIAGRVLLDDPRWFHLHGTGVFYQQDSAQ